MISGDKIKLRPKKLSDTRNDYAWQSDPELARLDAVPVLTISFTQYLLDYAWELYSRSPTRRQFAIETSSGQHIGNCSYYNINEARGDTELGIMIGNREYWDKGYGTDVVITLVNHIFRETNLNRIYLKTLDSNIRAQNCFQKCGFTPYERMARDGYNFMLMECYRRQWQQHKDSRNSTESYTPES